LGQGYFDCTNALGNPGVAQTYNFSMAVEARSAFPTPGADILETCSGSGSSAAVRQGSNFCAVWVYDTTLAGHVHL